MFCGSDLSEIKRKLDTILEHYESYRLYDGSKEEDSEIHIPRPIIQMMIKLDNIHSDLKRVHSQNIAFIQAAATGRENLMQKLDNIHQEITGIHALCIMTPKKVKVKRGRKSKAKVSPE